jgi:hypothetical protein
MPASAQGRTGSRPGLCRARATGHWAWPLLMLWSSTEACAASASRWQSLRPGTDLPPRRVLFAVAGHVPVKGPRRCDEDSAPFRGLASRVAVVWFPCYTACAGLIQLWGAIMGGYDLPCRPGRVPLLRVWLALRVLAVGSLASAGKAQAWMLTIPVMRQCAPVISRSRDQHRRSATLRLECRDRR